MTRLTALVGRENVPTIDGRVIVKADRRAEFVPVFADDGTTLLGKAGISVHDGEILAEVWLNEEVTHLLAEHFAPVGELSFGLDLDTVLLRFDNASHTRMRGKVAGLHVTDVPAWDDLWVKAAD